MAKKAQKVRLRRAIPVKAYAIVDRAIEEGAKIGWHRAHKYTDIPDSDDAAEAIRASVMISLCEVLDFGDS